jgi:AraC-like DNA-binding protein
MALTATPSLNLIHHDSPFGRWEMARALPAPALQQYVRAYEGYTEEVTNFAQRLEVPSRDVALIINFGPAFTVTGPGEPAVPVAYDSFVAGLHDSHALVAATGPSNCLQVDFTPLGAHQFFGIPMAELTSRTVALVDLLGPAADRLVGQLRDAPSWEARFALLDTLIAARLAAAPPPCDRLAWAWEQLHAAHGRLDIAALAAEIGWSNRHLIARFRDGFGLPPKTLARVLRFDHAVRLLQRHDTEPNWVALASACGYYDQAHLIRDFRAFSGQTPASFARRQIPDAGGIHGD